MGKLNGKVAIVTGGAGGIGAATARRFVDEGAKVMLVDIAEGPLSDVAASLGEAAAYTAADVSNDADAIRYVKETVKKFGGVDIMFANAGIEGSVAPLTETTVENFDRVQGVNVRGVWLALKHVAPELIKRGGGAVIMTSSVAGIRGFAGLGPYVASKHAVMGLMKTAAHELGPLGIRVMTVNPGPVDNRMMRSIEKQSAPDNPSAVKDQFTAGVPLGRYASNEDIANTVAFLASNEGAYCNGASFVVDGGFTA
jgi:NAD(P)-dependent dehydrogenase (short-subunit alcohol dehydrogenase family)